MFHYLYLVFDEANDYYIGRRSTEVDPSKDKYMGSCKNPSFKPVSKKVIALVDTYEDLKVRERSLIMSHIQHKKNRNGMVPPENDIFGSFRWANNGRKNIQVRDGVLPQGFKWGRHKPFGDSHPTKGTLQWVKDGETRRSETCPGEGWVQGSYYNGRKNLVANNTKGSFWITDGVNSKLCKPEEEIPEGWRRGRTIK